MKRTLSKVLFGAVGWAVAMPALAQVNTAYDPDGYGDKDVIEIILSLLGWILGILALVAAVLFVVGGIKWMTAQGSKDKVQEAQRLMLACIIGMLIIMAAWGIAKYAVGTLGSITGADV